jgi:ribulose-5-phosphate 4-epimerase/fuculose-1-phosphate aldolase
MATLTRDPETDAATEAALRRDLAAAFRLCALHGWDDHIATHMSARLPDGTFLLNPFGLLFEEITASSLMRVDLEGNILSPEGAMMNPAAYTIHSGVLEGRPDVNCVIHLHTLDGAAVSTMKEGLLPLTQTALQVIHDVAYHDYEGVADDLAERERLQADLGDRNLLILRNHGTLTTGTSVGEAFYRMMALEFACTSQIRALGTGREILHAPKEVQEAMPAQVAKLGGLFVDFAFWPAILRKAARDCPGFDA